MPMSPAQARTEIRSLYAKADEIEKRYPDGLTEGVNRDDYNEVKRLLSEVDGLESKLTDLEDVERRRDRIRNGIVAASRPIELRAAQQRSERDDLALLTPGDQFTLDPEYIRLKDSGRLFSALSDVRFTVNMKDGTSLMRWQRQLSRKIAGQAEEKAILNATSSSSGGAFVPNDLRAGLIDILQREINVLDLVPRYQTESDTIEYVREDTFTNAAAFVAEATGSAQTGTTGVKPETDLAYSAQTSAVRTLAHWNAVTNRMLADAPAIRGIINTRLLLGLALTLESQILTGNGTGENFTGILNANIQLRGKGTDNEMDALFKARNMVRVTGHARPNAIVLHPNDFEAIRLTRENAATATLGQYLMGPPSLQGATTIFGLPVVESEALTENTGLVGDFNLGAGLFDREQAAIRVGYINDQFIRNLTTILAEMRAAFVVWRPTAFARVTGL